MRMHGRACVNGDLRYSSELQLLPLPAQLRFSLVDRGTWCRSARVFRSSVRFFFFADASHRMVQQRSRVQVFS